MKGLKDVPKIKVIEFLEKYISVPGSRFDSGLITDWLNINQSSLLDNWDIIFVNGGSDIEYDYGMGLNGCASERKVFIPSTVHDSGIVKNNRSRLASPSDGRLGLSSEKLELLRKLTPEYKPSSLPQKEYFRHELQRKPVILVLSVIPKIPEDEDFNKSIQGNQSIPLLSVGIPELDEKKTKYVDYTVNKIYQFEEAEDGSDIS